MKKEEKKKQLLPVFTDFCQFRMILLNKFTRFVLIAKLQNAFSLVEPFQVVTNGERIKSYCFPSIFQRKISSFFRKS